MNSTSYATHSVNVSAYIQQAGMDHGIAYCLDGATHRFLDNYSQKLRASIKLAAHIFNRAGHCEHEIDGLISNLKLCRFFPSPDHDVVAVIEILQRYLLRSDFDQLNSMMPSRTAMGMFIADLCERVRDEGERTQAIADAIRWEHESKANSLMVKHAVEAAFADDVGVGANKVSFFRKLYMPADHGAALSVYERVKNNEALFQKEMSGEKVHRQPDALLRPDIDLIRRDLSTLKEHLDRAVWVKELLRGAVLTVDFSCIHGFYLSAIFLAGGHKKGSLEVLIRSIDRVWDEVTDGDGHARHWSESQCSWSGLFESNDTAKKTSLMLELEGRAMREKYVRPKGSASLPIFTFIQPATEGVQLQEILHA